MEKSFRMSKSGSGDPGDDLALYMWSGNLSNMGLESLGLVPTEEGSIPEAMSRRPDESDTNDRESNLSGNADQPWTLERLTSYVQAEVTSCASRITLLENKVQQLTLQLRSSHAGSQASILSEAQAGPSQSREISRGHLDRYCLRTLEQSPEPTAASLSAIAQKIAENSHYEHLDRKTIMSQVRKWFRKRREEMGTRLVSALKRRHLQHLTRQVEVEQLRSEIRNNNFDLAHIMAEAKLEIVNEEEATAFAKHKLLSFLDRYRVPPTAD